MKILRFILLAIFTIVCTVLYSQMKVAFLSFESSIHDFKSIKESDGPATYKFVFTNTGAVPLVIKNAQASCGCTTPDWSREPVLPGAKGFVVATYDPRNRIGKFTKTITVNYNGNPAFSTLTIIGEVFAKEPSLEEQYPYSFGELRSKEPQMTMGNVYLGEVKNNKFEFINPTQNPITLNFYNIPKQIKIYTNPISIEPGKTGVLEIEYNSKIKNDWGTVFDNFMIRFNNKEAGINFVISANLLEDFSKMSPEDIQNGPKAVIVNNEFNFGTLKAGEKASHKYLLRNTGKSILLLRKIVPSCGCTSVDISSKSIAAGDSLYIPIVFDSSGKNGEQNKIIQIYTNDPVNPRAMLWIKGKIE